MKKFLLTSIFCISSLLTFPQSASWHNPEVEGTAEERHENAFVQAGDQLILIGGRGQKPTDVYNLRTKKWTRGKQPPYETHHIQAVSMNGLVYILGGFTGGWPHETPLTHVLIYDPVEDIWAIGPKIPEDRQRGAAAAVTYNNKIYLINGIINGHSSGWVNWMDEFDPYTNTWKKLPNSPQKRDHFHAAVIGDKLFVAGGRKSGSVKGSGFAGTVKETNVYDFETGNWEVVADIPTPRAGSAVAVRNNNLVILGGESDVQEAAHNEVEMFDPETGNWKSLPRMKNGRHGTQAISLDDKIIIAAGSGNRGGGPELNDLEILAANEKIEFEADSLIKGTLSASAEELIVDGYREVEIENINGNTALFISYIQTDTPDSFEIKTPYETPFILAPNEKILLEIKAKEGANNSGVLLVKSLGKAAPVEVKLQKE